MHFWRRRGRAAAVVCSFVLGLTGCGAFDRVSVPAEVGAGSTATSTQGGSGGGSTGTAGAGSGGGSTGTAGAGSGGGSTGTAGAGSGGGSTGTAGDGSGGATGTTGGGTGATSGGIAGTAAQLTSPEQGGSLALVPDSYVEGVPNRWVLFFHGYNQDANTLLEGGYGEVAAALVQAGYVVIAMTNTVQNCFGSVQCNADVAALVEQYRDRLSLQSRPYVMADGMGGFTALNAMAGGVLRPRAVVGWSINTDLRWDFTDGGAAEPITVAYAISADDPYEVVTIGHDPMLVGGDAFARTPFALWSSYGDTVVPRAENTDRFAAMVNAAGGDVVVKSCSGENLDPSNFDPAGVVAFFGAH